MEDASPPEDPFAAMDPEMAAHPQPLFKMLRESMPVIPVEGRGVALTRRADVEEVFRHPEVFSSNADAVDLQNVRPLIPLQIDPPDHKKYRKLLDPIFAPREVAKLEESLTVSVNELIDRFADQGEVDFSAAFSTLFPTRVFLNLLGLPVDELPHFLALKDGIIRPQVAAGSVYGSPETLAYQKQTADAIYAYFDKVLDEREAERRDDLLSRFLDASVDGQRLTREDILDICFLFLIAGLDTVTASLDCMFAYLAEHPDQRRQLVDDPSLVPAAIEELLRWETPVMGVVRVAVAGRRDLGLPGPRGRPGHGHAQLGQHRRGRTARCRCGPLRPGGQPSPGLRRRRPPLPRVAPGPARAARRPAGMASADPRVRRGRRPHPGLHVGHPVDRPLPDDVPHALSPHTPHIHTCARPPRQAPAPTGACVPPHEWSTDGIRVSTPPWSPAVPVASDQPPSDV